MPSPFHYQSFNFFTEEKARVALPSFDWGPNQSASRGTDTLSLCLLHSTSKHPSISCYVVVMVGVARLIWHILLFFLTHIRNSTGKCRKFCSSMYLIIMVSEEGTLAWQSFFFFTLTDLRTSVMHFCTKKTLHTVYCDFYSYGILQNLHCNLMLQAQLLSGFCAHVET